MVSTEESPLYQSPLNPLPGGRNTFSATPKESKPDGLQADIDRLKDPARYQATFETKEAQQLSQGIEILARLQSEAYEGASRVGYEKLRNAKLYLDKLLKDHFSAEE